MSPARPRFRYATATSLDGFLADEANSLQWLFDVRGAAEAERDFARFLAGVGVQVEGSTTYEWVLDHEDLLAQPHKWREFNGDRPTYVFTSRDLPVPEGADVRFVRGDVADALPAITAAAGARDVWLVGGGDLVGQFADAGALDEVTVTIAPVTLGAGAPLLPRRIESDRLELVSAAAQGQFVAATYRMR